MRNTRNTRNKRELRCHRGAAALPLLLFLSFCRQFKKCFFHEVLYDDYLKDKCHTIYTYPHLFFFP